MSPAGEVRDGLTRPRYDAGGLAGVLPAVAASLGAPVRRTTPEGRSVLGLPQARRAVVALVDGLGYELLSRRGGHAPFLRGLFPDAFRLTAGFPSTTATSMGTFGTGLPPGAHGLVGYEVLIPERDRVFNELSWEDGPDPLVWQPTRTVFEELAAAGLDVAMVGPGYFDGSGLTRAALRGVTRFLAANRPGQRVPAVLEALRGMRRGLVYLYWGEVDKTGHQHGCDSWQWGLAVEEVDAALRELAASLPADTALYVTADHGMVDIPFASRVDLAEEPELAAGVRHLAGEARVPQVHVTPGALEDVRAAWEARLAETAVLRTRDEVLDLGWFGPGAVRDEVAARIGDLVVACRGEIAVVDSRTQPRYLLSLLGLHGSLTPDEVAIPLLSVAPGSQRS
ncbi:MAG: nucleotide pyrophosphatase/phosphodiesterase family protein [Dermatophilaceae bacterium]